MFDTKILSGIYIHSWKKTIPEFISMTTYDVHLHDSFAIISVACASKF